MKTRVPRSQRPRAHQKQLSTHRPSPTFALRLEKLGLRLVVAAEAAARNAAAEVAREARLLSPAPSSSCHVHGVLQVADAAASKLAELRRQLLKEAVWGST